MTHTTNTPAISLPQPYASPSGIGDVWTREQVIAAIEADRKRRGEPVDIRQEVIETLEMLLAADWRKWEELASPDEFVRWAKSRANYALSIINEAPQPAAPVGAEPQIGSMTSPHASAGGPAQPQPSGNAGELDDRAAFGQWVASTVGDAFAARRPDGRYVWDTTEDDFRVWRAAWQARAALQSQDREDAERLDWLREETCDLRCINVPTGGDDYDVRWVVIQHHMSKPHEREIGRSFTEEPRDAIDHARRIEGDGE